jgi:threonine dehydratase
MSPATEVYAAEPAGHDDLRRSLASGQIETNEPGSRSIADALMSAEVGKLPFDIHRRRVKASLVADDDRLLDAMAFAYQHLKLVVEPGGAAALAAVMAHREVFAAQAPVLVLLTGGNVDPQMFVRAIQRLT